MSNISHRACINIDSNIDRLVITIPPAYLWKNHNNFLYYSILFYSIFVLNSIAIAINTGFYGYIYGICFVATFIGDREFTQLVLGLQFALLVLLLCLFRESVNTFSAFSFFLCFIDNLFIGSLKNKLFKEFICKTRIEISETSILIKRKFWFSWQKDFYLNIKIDSKNLIFYLKKIRNLNLYIFIGQLRILLANMAKPSINRSHLLKKLESQQFQFGGWLSQEEISYLFKEVSKHINLNY